MAFTAGRLYQREKFIESDPGQATRWQIRGSPTFIAEHLGPIPLTPAHRRKVFLLNIENRKYGWLELHDIRTFDILDNPCESGPVNF